ncbi:MAG: glycosyltransferase family 4 protein [Patescibacteria group bacterium]
MKVCIYTHSFPPIIGGAQTYQYNIAGELAKRGHEVLVLTGFLPEGTRDEYKYEGFKVSRIASFRDFSKLKAPSNKFLEDTFFALKDFGPDIIYSNGYTQSLAISILKHGLNAKHVFSFHSTPEVSTQKIAGIWKGKLDLETAFAKFIMKDTTFDAYIACSKHYLNFVKEHLFPEIEERKNVHQVYYGVNLNKFSFKKVASRSKYGYRQEDFIVLSPVRLIPRKGILDLLGAIKILKEKRASLNIKLLIPSSALSTKMEFVKQVDAVIEDFNIKDSVRIEIDKFGIEEMPDLYGVSDVMVLPSYSEGLGIVSLEAMATKTPVIATGIPGVNEVVRHNETGLVVPIKNPKAIADSIVKLRMDTKLRRRLIDNGYRLVDEEFSLHKQVDKIELIFENLLKK